MRVLFLLYDIGMGGAERQVMILARGLRSAGDQVAVLCFYKQGALVQEFRAAGIPLRSLNKRSRWDIRFLVELTRTLRQENPDVLHSYLSLANIVAVLVKPFFPRMKVIWGLRATMNNVGRNDRFDRPIFAMERLLSRFADLIIHNSEAGRAFYAKQGFSDRKSIVIPNGIDTDRFVFDPTARLQVRYELGIGGNTPVMGMIARFDPMKGYPVFLKAAHEFLGEGRQAHFVLVGPGVTGDNPVFAEQRCGGVDGPCFHLLGTRHDIPALLSAFDVYTSASVYGEGFSNSIGEAMSCGVPCVVTDVGDSASIVADTGIVVQPGNPEALAQGWQTMLDRLTRERTELQEKTRARIVEHFGVGHLVQQTRHALEQVIGR